MLRIIKKMVTNPKGGGMQGRWAWEEKLSRQREWKAQKWGAGTVPGRGPKHQVNEGRVIRRYHQKCYRGQGLEGLIKDGAFMLCNMGSLGEFCTEELHASIYILTMLTVPAVGNSVRAFFKRCICSEFKFLESREHIFFFPEP